MNNNRWRSVERLFDETLELPEADRAAFIAQACDGDQTLQQEVESLLAAHYEAHGFLVASVTNLASANVRSNSTTVIAEQRIGPYKLLREIAQGGMGTVWLAARDDEQYQQQVAIKLLKTNSPDIAGRLRHERQILADLNHPNIARLLDGGTTDSGQPYLVMEYIEGSPVDAYCHEHQLTLRERLQLFRQVCAAVAYAHQHLIIHRDLKPANILVTADGTPKLLDFGIAKLLQSDLSQSYQTQAGQTPMTPAYASPEQVRSEKLATTSDVYSLGVVLYELLTGRSPYQLTTNTFGELSKAICEQDPVKPSTAVTQSYSEKQPTSSPRIPHSALRNLKGDLDSIVLMALRKEPRARYASVEQFSADIQRYLDGLPTLSRKGTFVYRAVKYVRRYKVPVAAAALILLSLLGGIGATSRQAKIARAEQAKAEAQRIRAEQALSVADEQRRRAEQALAEVEAQRTRAENALTTAEQRRRQADAARTEANQQRAAAETQRRAAEAERNVAQTQQARAEAQELSNRRLLYTAQMRLAQTAWDNANVERVRELLTAHIPQTGQEDLRGFEWYHLWKLSHAELLTLPHGSAVTAVAFTPDGKNLISITQSPADSTKVLRIQDAITGQEKYQVTGDFPSDIGKDVAVSTNPEIFATGEASMGLSLWNTTTGKRIKKIGESVFFLSFALSPEGTKLAGGLGNGSVILYDVQTGQELYRLKGDDRPIDQMTFSPDGKRLITRDNGRFALKIWENDSGRELLELTKELSYTKPVFLSDGRQLVSSTGDEHLTVIEMHSGKEVNRIKLQERVIRIAYSPKRKILAVGQYDRHITLWDTETWQMLTTIRGHSLAIEALAFSPDGQKLATAGPDTMVKLWDINPNQLSDTYCLPKSYVDEIEFSADANRLSIMAADQSVHVFDTKTRQELFTVEPSRDHRPEVWDRLTIKHPFAQTKDGSKIAVSRAQSIKLINAATGGELLTINTPGLWGYAISFSSDGRMVAANLCECEVDKVSGYLPEKDMNYLGIWDSATGQQILKIDKSDVLMWRTVFLRDGKTLVTGGSPGNLVWWDLATGKQKNAINTGADGSSLLLSPDSKVLALADKNASILLFDAVTGEKLNVLKGHNSLVQRMAFSPDSKRLLSGGRDRTARLWDLSTGQELLVFEKTSEAGGVAFSGDRKRIAISYEKGVVKELLAAEAASIASGNK